MKTKARQQGPRFRALNASNVNARFKGKFSQSEVSTDLKRNNTGVPIEIGVDITTHRLDLALKLADAIHGIIQLAKQ